MSPMTAAERSRRYRMAERLENALEKLSTVMEELPPDFDRRKLDLDLTHDFALLNALSLLLQRPWIVKTVPNGVSLQFQIPVNPELVNEVRTDEGVEEDYKAMETYLRWTRNEMAARAYEEDLSKQQFAESYLGAKLKSPKWGWVAVREPADGEAGALYLFCWEHASEFTAEGKGPVELFATTPSLTKSGSPHPGHRDAVVQIERAVKGELTPYIVWMSPVYPISDPPKLMGYDKTMLHRCSLSVSKDSMWVAQPETEVWPPFVEAPDT
jgi:hypothetical protein